MVSDGAGDTRIAFSKLQGPIEEDTTPAGDDAASSSKTTGQPDIFPLDVAGDKTPDKHLQSREQEASAATSSVTESQETSVKVTTSAVEPRGQVQPKEPNKEPETRVSGKPETQVSGKPETQAQLQLEEHKTGTQSQPEESSGKPETTQVQPNVTDIKTSAISSQLKSTPVPAKKEAWVKFDTSAEKIQQHEGVKDQGNILVSKAGTDDMMIEDIELEGKSHQASYQKEIEVSPTKEIEVAPTKATDTSNNDEVSPLRIEYNDLLQKFMLSYHFLASKWC